MSKNLISLISIRLPKVVVRLCPAAPKAIRA